MSTDFAKKFAENLGVNITSATMVAGMARAALPGGGGVPNYLEGVVRNQIATVGPDGMIDALAKTDPSIKPLMKELKNSPELKTAIHSAIVQDKSVLKGFQSAFDDTSGSSMMKGLQQALTSKWTSDDFKSDMKAKMTSAFENVANDPHTNFSEIMDTAHKIKKDGLKNLGNDIVNQAKTDPEAFAGTMLSAFGVAERFPGAANFLMPLLKIIAQFIGGAGGKLMDLFNGKTDLGQGNGLVANMVNGLYSKPENRYMYSPQSTVENALNPTDQASVTEMDDTEFKTKFMKEFEKISQKNPGLFRKYKFQLAAERVDPEMKGELEGLNKVSGIKGAFNNFFNNGSPSLDDIGNAALTMHNAMEQKQTVQASAKVALGF